MYWSKFKLCYLYMVKRDHFSDHCLVVAGGFSVLLYCAVHLYSFSEPQLCSSYRWPVSKVP